MTDGQTDKQTDKLSDRQTLRLNNHQTYIIESQESYFSSYETFLATNKMNCIWHMQKRVFYNWNIFSWKAFKKLPINPEGNKILYFWAHFWLLHQILYRKSAFALQKTHFQKLTKIWIFVKKFCVKPSTLSYM